MPILSRALVVLTVVLTTGNVTALATAEPLAIIVNQANPTSHLTLSEIASIYRGETLHWSYGKRIKLVNREISSPIRRKFYREVLNAKPGQKFYRPGTPITIQSLIQRSDDAVIRFVATIEGAIGYTWASKIAQPSRQHIKVIGMIPSQ